MTERPPAQPSRQIAPKDVFDRSNKPSRWERITSVSPKTPWDRKYLAFVAARYRGEERLPHPDELAIPDEFHERQQAKYVGWAVGVIGIALWIIGLGTQVVALSAVGAVFVVGAVVIISVIWTTTGSAIRRYQAERSRCKGPLLRLYADSLDSQNTITVNKMINCDEGTLAYCAAKIASEIEQDPAWWSERLDFIAINLWDEVAGIGRSAKQIADDRKALEALEDGRLSNAPDVRGINGWFTVLAEQTAKTLPGRMSGSRQIGTGWWRTSPSPRRRSIARTTASAGARRAVWIAYRRS